MPCRLHFIFVFYGLIKNECGACLSLVFSILELYYRTLGGLTAGACCILRPVRPVCRCVTSLTCVVRKLAGADGAWFIHTLGLLRGKWYKKLCYGRETEILSLISKNLKTSRDHAIQLTVCNPSAKLPTGEPLYKI